MTETTPHQKIMTLAEAKEAEQLAFEKYQQASKNLRDLQLKYVSDFTAAFAVYEAAQLANREAYKNLKPFLVPNV